MKAKQTRRIRKDLKQFFDKQNLTDSEKAFILGCISAQQQFPQLTARQWQIVQEIKERYNNVQISGSKETS
jgi:sulfur relay (sulfurtransferase) DsrC/TusE family protein